MKELFEQIRREVLVNAIEGEQTTVLDGSINSNHSKCRRDEAEEADHARDSGVTHRQP